MTSPSRFLLVLCQIQLQLLFFNVIIYDVLEIILPVVDKLYFTFNYVKHPREYLQFPGHLARFIERIFQFQFPVFPPHPLNSLLVNFTLLHDHLIAKLLNTFLNCEFRQERVPFLHQGFGHLALLEHLLVDVLKVLAEGPLLDVDVEQWLVIHEIKLIKVIIRPGKCLALPCFWTAGP